MRTIQTNPTDPKLRTPKWGHLLLATLTLGSGCAADASDAVPAPPVESKVEGLIGGAPVAQGDYRATVGINNDCSATKVGTHHFLTAAHCVQLPRPSNPDEEAQLPPDYLSNGGVRAAYLPGADIEISWGLHANDQSQGTFTIEETVIHPSWWDCLYCRERPTVMGMADIAVIRLLEPTPQIPQARVEVGDVRPGQKVVKVGYGCQDRVPDNLGSAADGEGLGPLKAEEGWTLPVNESAPPGGSFRGGFEPIDESYLITGGHARYSGFGSLCLGDSGGPLYLAGVPDLRVVGVNSDYTFYGPPGISWSDWHTRTSLASQHGIGFWLISQGVDIAWTTLMRGTITFERWNNAGGTSIWDIPAYRPPSEERNIDRFEIYAGQDENGDNYAVRMRGYLIPPETGTYVFSIAGDDNVTLRLSSDYQTYNTQQIAYHNGYTGVREWNKYSTQRSQPIHLYAGYRYYIEAQMKEGGGQDHLAVGWNLPGQHANPPQVIPGAYLEPYLEDPLDDWACSCPEGCDSVILASVPGRIDNPSNGCFFFENLGSSIESENMLEVNLNGQDITNVWLGSGAYPARRDAGYYLYVEGNQNYDEEEPFVNLAQ